MPQNNRTAEGDKSAAPNQGTSDKQSARALDLETAPYRGARDFYPQEQRVHDWIFQGMAAVVELFGYEAYNAPMLEPLNLYAAKSGRELVEEQVYILTDRGQREIAIRPEMTPSLARMVAARINELNFPLRWYSFPNLWRYERPQRGRTREHWQLNVDLIGVPSQEGELEVLEIAIRIMQKFGASPQDCQVNFSNRKFLSQYLEQEAGLESTKRTKLSKRSTAVRNCLMRLTKRFWPRWG
jgi:histidyl-tRNA synthetase